MIKEETVIHVLVVDDEPGVGMIFSKILGEQGYAVHHCVTAEESLTFVESSDPPAIVFLDIHLPGMDGITALRKFLQINPALRIVMMTAYQTVESAVTTMKSGAVDYLVKPLNSQMLLQAIQKYAVAAGVNASAGVDNRTVSSSKEGVDGRRQSRQPSVDFTFAAHTSVMKDVLSKATQFASSDNAVLVLGESGTGKELLARYIHHQSARFGQSFVAIDCAAIPESLFESELFGYEKGAFTGAESSKIGRFELADGGTLFLDEIGNMPLLMQAKLLRFIEDHTILRLGGRKSVKLNIRLVTATNVDLQKAIEKGTFRADLYYRLAGLVVQLPPLRNRPKEEKEFLSNYFLQKNAKELNKSQPALSEAVRHMILDYPWPGNVRELQSALYSASLLCNAEVLDASHFPVGIQSYFSHKEQVSVSPVNGDKTLKKILKKVEREEILSTLKQTGGNKKKASEILGMDYKSFLSKLKEYLQEEDVKNGNGQ